MTANQEARLWIRTPKEYEEYKRLLREKQRIEKELNEQKRWNLSPTDEKIISYLLAGYENRDMAKELNIALRTIKEHFHQLFRKFEITSGVKRVKLAVMFYRRQLGISTALEYSLPANTLSSTLSLQATKIAKLQN